MTQTFFTIEPTYSGVADQLTQFNAFYKLGLHLGYAYLHTPFVSERSNGRDLAPNAATADVHEFVGLNEHFARRAASIPLAGGPARSLSLKLPGDEWPGSEVGSLDSIGAGIEQQVRRFAGQAADDLGSPVLVKFQLAGERRYLFSRIQADLPDFQDGLDLPGIYAAARKRSPLPSLYGDQGLKILLHIRQGDTGIVTTPWRTFIPIWSSRKDQFREYGSFDEIPARESQFDVSEYKSFLDDFLRHLGPSAKSVLVFSDGAARAFKAIESNLGKLAWSPEQIQRFREAKPGYDQRQFECFSGNDDIRLQLGEEPEKLCQLIHSAIESDLIIVSNQQRLIPKLMASFGKPDAPRVIVLCRGDIPVNTDLVRDHEARYIYIDIGNPDFDALLRRVRA